MTPSQEILSRLNTIESKLNLILKTSPDKDSRYLFTKEVVKKYNVSEKTLGRRRETGVLKDWKCSDTGRNYQYSKKELDKVFSQKA